MALDTSVITAGIKPITQTNPLAMAGDLAKTQNTLLQARGNALQMAATMAQGQHWQEATNPNTGEFDAGKYAAAIAADPRTAWNAGKIVQQLQAQQKAQYDLNSQALQQTDARSGVLANALGPLARLGNNAQPSDVYGVVNRLHAAGYPTGEMVNQIAASMPTQGGQGLHNWVLNTLGSRMSPADQARTFLPQVGTMNTGGTTQTYDANPQTNPNVTSMAVPNTSHARRADCAGEGAGWPRRCVRLFRAGPPTRRVRAWATLCRVPRCHHSSVARQAASQRP